MQTADGYFLICLYLGLSASLCAFFSLALFDMIVCCFWFCFCFCCAPVSLAHASHNILPIRVDWNTLPEYGMVCAGSIMVFQISIKIRVRTHMHQIHIRIWIVNDMVRWWANDSTKRTNQMRIKCSESFSSRCHRQSVSLSCVGASTVAVGCRRCYRYNLASSVLLLLLLLAIFCYYGQNHIFTLATHNSMRKENANQEILFPP